MARARLTPTDLGRIKLAAAASVPALLLCGCGTVENQPPDAAVAIEESLIDDLDDGNRVIPSRDGRVGYWYTLNDGTGTQSPAPGTPFIPATGGATDSPYCAATAGGGFTDWGAKLGVYLHNERDAQAGVYDASRYTGIRFQARGTGRVTVRVLTEAVRGESVGGACVEAGGGCFDYHGLAYSLTPDWREYSMAFADMAQEGWGRVIAFDPAGVVAIDFTAGANQEFDFAVDNLRLH